jgi:hypothetical protein
MAHRKGKCIVPLFQSSRSSYAWLSQGGAALALGCHVAAPSGNAVMQFLGCIFIDFSQALSFVTVYFPDGRFA